MIWRENVKKKPIQKHDKKKSKGKSNTYKIWNYSKKKQIKLQQTKTKKTPTLTNNPSLSEEEDKNLNPSKEAINQLKGKKKKHIQKHKKQMGYGRNGLGKKKKKKYPHLGVAEKSVKELAEGLTHVWFFFLRSFPSLPMIAYLCQQKRLKQMQRGVPATRIANFMNSI